MRQFSMRTFVPEPDQDQVYGIICDFPSYARHSTAVREVAMRPGPGGTPVSAWDVNFRGGVMRWVEEDDFHPDQHRIDFRQLEGDLEVFTGSWLVEPADGGSVIVFAALFDLGIPTLEDVLEPIAAEALEENIEAICAGLFGAGTRVLSVADAPLATTEPAGR